MTAPAPEQQVQLQRRLGLFSATCLVVANMIGTGIFTTSGYILGQLGSSAALLACWLIGGVFALCGALCYAELGANFPRAGGEYVFLRQGLGQGPAFLSGWISLVVGFSAPIAAAAIALSVYLRPWLGITDQPWAAWTPGGVTVAAVSPVTLVAAGVIVLLSLVHYLGVVLGSRVQNLLTVFKLTILAAFLAGGFWVLPHGPSPWQGPGLGAAILDGRFAVSLILVSFAYSGWNAAAYLGGEIKNPVRNIPAALIGGTVLVCVVYLLINLLYVKALPGRSMAGVLEVGAAAAQALFGQRVGGYFGLAIALGLLSVLSSMIMTGPRVYYAMSRDGLFFSALGRVSPRRGTPAASIFLQAALALVMVFTASFETLLIYIGFTLSLCSLLTVVGLIRLRRQGRLDAAFKSPGHPLPSLLFVAGNLWIITHSLVSQPLAPVWGLITIGAGGLVYIYFRRRQGRTPC